MAQWTCIRSVKQGWTVGTDGHNIVSCFVKKDGATLWAVSDTGLETHHSGNTLYGSFLSRVVLGWWMVLPFFYFQNFLMMDISGSL